jgi:dihydrofolate reductase
MNIRIVVAASENNVIGLDNQLPWHLPDDLKFFKKMTHGMPVVMGKNTWISLGKALSGRLNVVISSSLKDLPEGVLLFESLEDALAYLRDQEHEEISIIGGGQLYHSSLDYTHTVYLTRVHAVLDKGTATFPELPDEDWKLVWEEPHAADDRHKYAFTFQQWERK